MMLSNRCPFEGSLWLAKEKGLVFQKDEAIEERIGMRGKRIFGEVLSLMQSEKQHGFGCFCNRKTMLAVEGLGFL